jgi:HEPN domain-containing protein
MAPQSSEPIRRRAAEAWFDDAESDLATARSLSRHREEGTAPFAAAFHAQQAIEKALKALLVYYEIAYPSKHDLGLLIGLLPDGLPTTQVPMAGLTVYAVEQHYVAGVANPISLNERPTWDDADEAISIAAQAIAAISGDLTNAFAQVRTEDPGDDMA